MSRKTWKKQQSIHLVVPPHIRHGLEAFLADRSADGREALAFLLCGQHKRRNLLRLLARHVVLPEDDCFARRSAGGIECLRALDEFVLKIADDEGLRIVAIHTHPHSGPPSFSPTDDRCERARAEAIHGTLGTRVALGSVVYNETATHYRGRFWRCSPQSARPVDMEIVSSLGDSVGEPSTKPDRRFDRQVRVFGAHFQGYLEKLRVGIVGVGGLGSMVVEGLARLGVRRWVIVDPDAVETSNLNRLSGATRWDAVDSVPKVVVARRNVRQIHGRRSEVCVLREGLSSSAATRLLSDCHVLRTED